VSCEDMLLETLAYTRLLVRNKRHPAIRSGPVDRNPWVSAKRIPIHLEGYEKEHTTLVVYSNLAKHMMLKRLFGNIREYIVVEYPLVV
jgi:hypothetical protein